MSAAGSAPPFSLPSAIARGWFAPAALCAAYVAGVLPSIGQPLLESHAHRQTQTAYTAVLYAESGIDLLRPPLPVLGPPGAIPQELPLFQAIGALIMHLGIAPDMAMRLAGIACFIGSAVILYLLARRLMGRPSALVALAAYVFNAHAWLYGRSSMIEYLATAGALGFLYFSLRWTDDRRMRDWALAFAAGSIGILVKITTGGFYLLPALLLRSRSGRWGYQRVSIWGLLILVTGLGLAWSWHAEAVRSETPAAAFLSLRNQLPWFFGTPGQRFDLAEWRVPLVATLMLTGSGVVVWAALAMRRATHGPQRAFLLGTLALFPAAALILFNLYAVHDYYFSAVAPVAALAIGLGTEHLLASWDRRWARNTLVGLAGAWLATLIGLAGSWSLIYREPPEQYRVLEISRSIQEASDPEEWVVVRGLGWNPAFLYYARRQGLGIPEEGTLQDTTVIDFDALLRDPIFGPYIDCELLTGRCRASAHR